MCVCACMCVCLYMYPCENNRNKKCNMVDLNVYAVMKLDQCSNKCQETVVTAHYYSFVVGYMKMFML